jgi:N-acetyl-D-muramate 6-phosphate phosphatase
MSLPPFPTDIQAVLFDLDGTLIDSAPDLGAAADKMRTDRGLPSLPLERYRSMAGAGARGMLGIAFDMTPQHPDFPAWREEFFVNYENCMTERTYAFEGVPELIAQLTGRGLAWGVVTNKASRFTDPLTRGMPLFASARAIVSGDTTPHAKPHPAPLLEAARRLGLVRRARHPGRHSRRNGHRGCHLRLPRWFGRHGTLGRTRHDRFAPVALEVARTGLKYELLGLHWFRRGFGRVAGHVELNVLVKQIQTN